MSSPPPKLPLLKKSVLLLALSQCGKHTLYTLRPLSHTNRHQCL
ncbi:hypothetical protein NC652_022309 [Populus alba x Populus x berolinensis]|uniref:Uncharacterized protein n=1 Tax=Populus alba x Populus x berolinensis TaxID=444605 RepID=A0AAD6QFM3_9ROSI|nr:hypothetical protein NC652_022309 [Populus alba x Populus x berolinensis]KAJ6989454.1 hypothetical protein NC653_022128 [Populus alba x Populus x berolinensis]